MSSEESAEEDFDGKKRPVIAIKPLPWRTAIFDRFLDVSIREMTRKKLNRASSKLYHVL